MTAEELAAQTTLTNENAVLKGRLAVMESNQNQAVAAATVAAVLKESGVGFKQSLLLRACANPVLKEGKIDPKWIEEVTADFMESTGGTRVTGLGLSQTKEAATEQKTSDDQFKESLLILGVPEKGIGIAMGGKS